MFDDIFSAPFQRAFEAQTFYTELQMRVDKDYLNQHTDAMDKILSDPKGINIGDVALMNTQLKERLEFIVDADLLYKLASVLYFDENESPYKYDFAYGAKKIAKWKKDFSLDDFFLSTPIKDFIPFLESLESDLSTYLRVTERIKEQHQATISKQLSKREGKTGS